MTKVLYVTGWGRSGSTILDTLLGQVEGFFSTGELWSFFSAGLVSRRPCGCGAPLPECPVWGEVIERAFGSSGGVDAQAMAAFAASGPGTRHLPLLLAGRARWPAPYRDAVGRLYRAIQEVTGCRVIVDSSKAPPYGRLLESIPGLDVRVVHLVRDPRAVAYSWSRTRRHPDGDRELPRVPPGRSALMWTLTNVAARAFWGRSGRYLPVRYEDFVTEPRETVRRIVRFAGEDGAEPSFIDARRVRMGPTHTVYGNPSRFSHGVVELRPDVEWRERLPLRQRLLVTAATAPSLHRYGYRLVPRRSNS